MSRTRHYRPAVLDQEGLPITGLPGTEDEAYLLGYRYRTLSAERRQHPAWQQALRLASKDRALQCAWRDGERAAEDDRIWWSSGY